LAGSFNLELMKNLNENKLILRLLLLMAFADKIYRKEEEEFVNLKLLLKIRLKI